ncbi:MAG: cytochrome c [Alphaproteobacteria bacterium]|nr:cytochrome c [Alphaproteobacteria bacterium]
MLRTYGAGHYIPQDKVAAIIHYLQANYTPATIGHNKNSTKNSAKNSASAHASVKARSGNTATAGVAAPGPHSAGALVFRQNCQVCHQASGHGITGTFPPLAGHLPDVLAATGGRQYLADAVLFGLHGSITVNGRSYNGSMPVWAGRLTDKQIADVLNYAVTAWHNNRQLPSTFKAYSARDIASGRRKNLKPAEVHKIRAQLKWTGRPQTP